MRRGLLFVLILISIGCLNGCKPTKRTPEPPPPATNESLATTPRGRQGIEMLTVLIPEQDGLDGLIRQNSQPIQSDEASRRLASESVLIRILKEEELVRVLSTLEGGGAAQNTWCGQMMEWRDLLEHRTKNQLMMLQEALPSRRIFVKGAGHLPGVSALPLQPSSRRVLNVRNVERYEFERTQRIVRQHRHCLSK